MLLRKLFRTAQNPKNFVGKPSFSLMYHILNNDNDAIHTIDFDKYRVAAHRILQNIILEQELDLITLNLIFLRIIISKIIVLGQLFYV